MPSAATAARSHPHRGICSTVKGGPPAYSREGCVHECAQLAFLPHLHRDSAEVEENASLAAQALSRFW